MGALGSGVSDIGVREAWDIRDLAWLGIQGNGRGLVTDHKGRNEGLFAGEARLAIDSQTQLLATLARPSSRKGRVSRVSVGKERRLKHNETMTCHGLPPSQ